MKVALQHGAENNPTKATVESVLPGVHQQFTNLHLEINRVRSGIDDLKKEIGVTGMCVLVVVDFIFKFANTFCCFLLLSFDRGTNERSTE